jgi:putative ABC transport system permease protein
VEGVAAALSAAGARSVDRVPVVMARLAGIDGVPVDELGEGPGRRGRERWVLTREQRLTWRAELPADNELVAVGAVERPEHAEVSLEQGFAGGLDAGLGARLSFDVQGVPVELLVTSIRTVDWRASRSTSSSSSSRRPGRGAAPGARRRAPGAGRGRARAPGRIATEFPNVTVLRVRPILEKLAGLLARVALGVRPSGASPWRRVS